jgi:hypothetical protein
MMLGAESIVPLGLKLLSPLINAFRSVGSLFGRRRWKLVIVERGFSGWVWGQHGEKGIIHLRGNLAATNRNRQDAVVPVRAQVGLGRFAYLRAMQDCRLCAIGGEHIVPFRIDIKIDPRTTVMIEITHPFEVKSLPRTKMLWFWIVVIDQLGRKHTKRVRLGKLY